MKKPKIDILSVDLGCNDLCDPEMTPLRLMTHVEGFIHTLMELQIRPKILVFLTQLKRTFLLPLSNQVNLNTYNARVQEFNTLLNIELSKHKPEIQVWSQEPYNDFMFLRGSHLNEKGMAKAINNLADMFLHVYHTDVMEK